ncbi:MAG: hypothetical protein V4773_13915 [Verrucomicrobiota bacterium]
MRLEWTQREDLPDAVGRKGMFGGVSGGYVLLAGGSNFPTAQRAGGKKTFHRDVFLRELPLATERPWRVAEYRLPVTLGEGATVTTKGGIACLGGHDGNAPVATAFLLSVERGEVRRQELPELPQAVTNGTATALGGMVYVAGGEGNAGALGTFWRLDLDKAGARWEKLPAWPGKPRFGCILNVVTLTDGPRIVLAGGLPGPAKSMADYLRDVVVFDPKAGTWTAGATMPRGAVLGSSVALGGGRLLVLGGSDGHDFERMKELGERYRIPSDLMVYDVAAARWSPAGTMPLGVVGATVVDLGGSWLVAGGEYTPGVRTPRVDELKAVTR